MTQKNQVIINVEDGKSALALETFSFGKGYGNHQSKYCRDTCSLDY